MQSTRYTIQLTQVIEIFGQSISRIRPVQFLHQQIVFD